MSCSARPNVTTCSARSPPPNGPTQRKPSTPANRFSASCSTRTATSSPASFPCRKRERPVWNHHRLLTSLNSFIRAVTTVSAASVTQSHPNCRSDRASCLTAIILIAAIVIAAAVTPRAVGEQVPESHQNNRAYQRAEQGDTGHVDIPDAVDDEQVRHQPDADEGGNDCPDDTKGQPPANDIFRDYTNNRSDNQVNDETRADCENSVTKSEQLKHKEPPSYISCRQIASLQAGYL